MSANTALLIINPNSRSADSTDMQAGINHLEAAGIAVQRVESSSAGETRQAIAGAGAEVGMIILAGGDGTLHSALGAILDRGLPLAVLPLGTGNDFARSAEIPLDLEAAFEVIARGHCRRVDLGRLNGEWFLNAASIGLGVAVSQSLTAEEKRSLGVFSYLKAMLDALSRSRSFRVRLEVDGRRYRLRSFHLAVGNGRFYGGGNVIHEDATVDEGLLRLYSIKPQAFWRLLLLAPLWRRGQHHRVAGTFSVTGKHMVIRTRKPLEVTSDGEPATHTPAELEVRPGALEIIAPAPATTTTTTTTTATATATATTRESSA